MTTYLETNTGLINNAGYQSIAGKQLYSTNQGSQNIINENVGIELPWVNGATPEVEFKRLSKPDPTSFVHLDKCPPSFHTSIESNNKEMFVIAPQNGYKTRGFSENNLRGISAIEGSAIYKYVTVDESEEPQLDISSELVNLEASAFQYGNQDYPPAYGARLPGALSTLQKSHTSGRIITTHKRAGYAPGGYASGWNSARTNLSGTVDPTVGS